MDLSLRQLDLAERLEVASATVRLWELDRLRPTIRHWPRILAFLGYDPEPAAEGLPGRLLGVRRHLGLTQAELAARLGQDEKQVCRPAGSG